MSLDNFAPRFESRPATESATPGAPPAAAAGLRETVHALLERALHHVQAREGMAAFRLLTAPLSSLWTEALATAQAGQMREWCRAHPLHALVQQDPFTHRAASKPRGYAGDAVMMDFLYDALPPQDTSEFGRGVFAATTRASTGLSVRWRRELLKSWIDETVNQVAGARMLSVACGHARELEGSLIESPMFDGEFIALDQDPASCAEVALRQAGRRVTVLNRGVRELLATDEHGKAATTTLGRFDLIYSAGLYDYLPDAFARKLTRKLLALLRPGGRLLIANFLPGASGRAYMELFMDWTLILRTEMELRTLALAAGAARVSSFIDPHHNVVYAELSPG